NRLAIDDRHAGSRFLAVRLPDSSAQGLVNFPPHAIATPTPEDRVHRLPLRKIMGQRSPLATHAIDVQDGIQNPPPTNRPSTTLRPSLGSKPRITCHCPSVKSLGYCRSIVTAPSSLT